MSVMAFLPTILQAQGTIAQAAGVLSALAVVANAAGNLGGGALIARGTKPRRLIAMACVLMIVAAAGIFLQQLPATPRYVLVVILSAAGGLIPASVFALLPRAVFARGTTGRATGGGPAAGGFQVSALVLVPCGTAGFFAARGLRRVS